MVNLDEIIKYSSDLKLLYVEDKQEVRISTLDILKEFFDDIIIAVDGRDGFKKFQDNEISKENKGFDIIITDVDMPNLNGLQMVKKIKDINDNIPIFILLVYNETNLFIDAIKFGVEAYLLKPFDMKQFTIALGKCIKALNLKKENLEYKNSLEVKIDRQLEDLKQKDKIILQQSKMAAIGEMIDAVAHQWKQPLSVIKLQSELLQLDLIMDTTNKQNIQNSTDTTIKQIKHLTDTIDEFRDFFRPTHNIKSINLKSLLNSIIILLKDELGKHSIKIQILCEDDIFIEANKNDIKHLIINIVNNAKDEMVKSNIDTYHRNIKIQGIKNDNNVIVTVKDNGNGIPQDIIDNIFKPYFTTKKDIGGTGIGLYICNTIVEKYKGTIAVADINTNQEQNLNGTVFTVTLPNTKD